MMRKMLILVSFIIFVSSETGSISRPSLSAKMKEILELWKKGDRKTFNEELNKVAMMLDKKKSVYNMMTKFSKFKNQLRQIQSLKLYKNQNNEGIF